MDKQEAYKALEDGHRVRHRNFAADEWVEASINPHVYIYEDDVRHHRDEFWAMRQSQSWLNGWEIIAKG